MGCDHDYGPLGAATSTDEASFPTARRRPQQQCPATTRSLCPTFGDLPLECLRALQPAKALERCEAHGTARRREVDRPAFKRSSTAQKRAAGTAVQDRLRGTAVERLSAMYNLYILLRATQRSRDLLREARSRR
jgi:hypothetical protein